MSTYGEHRKHFHEYEAYEEEGETDSFQEWEDEFDEHLTKSEKHKLIRKKIEEMIEQKKLRHEVDDYEEEIFKEYQWKDNQ